MTISSEVRKAGPYSANGSNKNFAFTFKCFTNTDVRVVLTDSLGAESDLVLDSDYSVTLNPDQNVSAGGTIITTIAYATGNKITLVGDVDFTQETDITNGGGFYPEVIENALDKLTMQMQQLKESVGRAAKVDISSGETGEDLISSINETAGEAAASAASAAEQVTLAEEQVALAQGIYDEFDDRYLGSKSSAPTLDNDGNAILDGALYWNSATKKLQVYDLATTSWKDTAVATPASFNTNVFSGTGSATTFTLSTTPASLSSVFVFISGAAQRPTLDYTISGTTLSFTTAPTAGTNNILAFVASTIAAGTPDDGSVSTAKIQDGAVVNAKIADSSITAAKIASGIVGMTFGAFRKSNPSIVAFSKTGNFTVSTASILYVEVNSVLKTIASGTAVTMPSSPAAGTDYAIWAKTDGTLEATTNHTSPPTANARKIGGFHYAPGGHSGASGGGNSTAQINQYSFWDLKFRPACPDPRGMALVADGFWADIYLLGVDHLTNGTSKYNVTMADGTSPPKIPTKFGGNGTTAYSSLNWWEACEVLKHHGKRAPTYSEFAALAFGTTEASSIGTDPVTTSFSATYFSKWGINQASGVLWIWGDEFGGGAAGASYVANTGGRGSTYQMENAALFGGSWVNAAVSGSRCSYWNYSPTYSDGSFGARGVADHFQAD